MDNEKRVITELTLQNILKIKAIHIKPSKNAVTITGKNAQGKSSVLNGIEMVLRGKSAFPENPIRDGETKAAGQIDLGDFIITRQVSPHSLEVKAKDTGERVQRPQEFLDSLLGKYTMDPLKILRLSGQDQLDEIKRILGLDFSRQDKESQDLYEKRRDLSRDLRVVVSALYDKKEVKPAEKISVDALIGSLKIAQEINNANKQKRNELDAARSRLMDLRARQAILELERKRIETESASLVIEVDSIMEKGAKLRESVDKIKDIDEGAITSKLSSTETNNDLAREYAELLKLKEDEKKLKDSLSLIESRMNEILEEKKSAVSAAEINMSVPGIGVDENGALVYNKVPLHQISQAEQIKVCMALAMRDNPNIGVILIREASLLDDDNLKLVIDIATENGYQVWLEKVDDKSGTSFIIEDGEISEEPTVKGE